jgi:hypothetical protein
MRDDDYQPAARPETVLIIVIAALVGVLLAKLWERFGW